VRGRPNVLKHADGASCQVVIRWCDAAIELEIRDNGSQNQDVNRNAPAGRGIVGMKERAAMYGGILDVHPAPERGYLVSAHIPLPRGGR
jgi:signal transduction histidine kinase